MAKVTSEKEQKVTVSAYDPYSPKIEVNNAAFQRRLRKFHRSKEGQALRSQIKEIRAKLLTAYRDIAIAHWQELGNDASTGWGGQSDGTATKPEVRGNARYLAEKLTDYLLEDPDYALGAK